VDALGRLQIVQRFPSILSGRYVEDERVDYFTDKRLEIDAEPPTEIQADGDIIGTTPATIELLPGALQLIIPEPIKNAI
jgi:diacylglycerol kinase family enzyme